MKLSPDRLSMSSLSSWEPTVFESGHSQPSETEIQHVLALFGFAMPEGDRTTGINSQGEVVGMGPINTWAPETFTALPHLQHNHFELQDLSFPPLPADEEDDPERAPEESSATPAMAEKMLQHEREKLLTEVHSQADVLLQNAEEQANRLLKQAQEDAAALVEQVRAEAYRLGIEQAQRETTAALAAAQALGDGVVQWREQMLKNSESDVIGLVKEIARSMFFDGIALDPNSLQQAFNQFFDNARSLGALRVYIHPDDLVALGPYWRENQMAISGQNIQMVPSESIHRGGCFIEGQFGSVDAQMETQLDAILKSLDVQLQAGATE